MAGRSFQPLLGTLDPGVVILGISWATNAAGAVDQTTIKGRGVASVTHTSAGLFTVTLQDVYADLLAATASLQPVTAADQFTQIGVSNLTNNTKTIQVRVWDVSATALTDTAAASDRINLVLVLKNSGV